MKAKTANIGLIPIDSPSIERHERLHQGRASEMGHARAPTGARRLAVVKQHGGSIEVDTEPGKFAEIRVI